MKKVIVVLMAVLFLGATTGLSFAEGAAPTPSQSSAPGAKKTHHKLKKHTAKKKAKSKATSGTMAK